MNGLGSYPSLFFYAFIPYFALTEYTNKRFFNYQISIVGENQKVYDEGKDSVRHIV